jgi:hypothetical protein
MGKLFMSREGRKRQERSERRKAFRDAERAVDNVKDRIRQMQREGDKQWQQARDAVKSGQKAAAQRFLTGYRATQTLAAKLEQKRWVFEQYLAKMEMARSDQDFSEALGGLNKVVQIDPEKVADVFESAQDILGEQVDSDRFWERLYRKEMDGAEGSMEDYIPSLDQLSSQLEQEAAAEVGGATERVDSELDKRIGEGQARVRDLLDGKQ